MKSVTGEIVSSTAVSLSRAANILSNFVAADNGASQAVNAYLRRATSAFGELLRLHSKPERRAHRSDAAEHSAPTTSVTTVDERTRRVQQSKETAWVELNSPHTSKTKKKKEDEVEVEEERRKGDGNVEEEELSSKKMTKKTKKRSDLGTSGHDENKKGVEVKGEKSHGDANFGDLGSEGDKQMKKKKKDKSKELENGDVDGYKENGGRIGEQDGVSGKKRIKEEEHKSDGLKQKEANRKKRKSGEIEEERRDNSQSEERPRKKKR